MFVKIVAICYRDPKTSSRPNVRHHTTPYFNLKKNTFFPIVVFFFFFPFKKNYLSLAAAPISRFSPESVVLQTPQPSAKKTSKKTSDHSSQLIPKKKPEFDLSRCPESSFLGPPRRLHSEQLPTKPHHHALFDFYSPLVLL